MAAAPCVRCKSTVTGIRINGACCDCIFGFSNEAAERELAHQAHLYHVAKEDDKQTARENLKQAARAFVLAEQAAALGRAAS